MIPGGANWAGGALQPGLGGMAFMPETGNATVSEAMRITMDGFLSIGNLSASSLVQSDGSTPPHLVSSNTLPGGTVLTVNGQSLFGGSAPSIANNDCGSGPQGSVVAGSTNNAFTVTVGGGAVTSCKVTFSSSFSNAPSCTEADSSTATTGDISAVAAGSVTFGFSISVAGGTIYGHCF